MAHLDPGPAVLPDAGDPDHHRHAPAGAMGGAARRQETRRPEHLQQAEEAGARGTRDRGRWSAVIWDWDYFWEALPIVVGDGLWITFQVTLLGSIVAYVLGMVLALLRRSPIRVVSTVTWAFIEFIRGTPLLV